MSSIQSVGVTADMVPPELLERPNWVCWRAVMRDGKPTKMPLRASDGRPAKTTDPADWCGFDEARKAAERIGATGVGFVFASGDGLCGIDFDDCIDEQGQLHPDAAEIVTAMNSYTEISPSGRGVKIFIGGVKPEGSRSRVKASWGGQVEVYDKERYFTVTGNQWPGTPLKVEHRQEELDALVARLLPPEPPRSAAVVTTGGGSAGFEGNDGELVKCAMSAANGAKFASLWMGDTSAYGGDQSRADMALCSLLAFWTGRDAGRMDRLFRGSGLMRAKWDDMRGAETYGQMTIRKAIERCSTVYTPGGGATPPDPDAAGLAVDDADSKLPPQDQSTGKWVLDPKRTLPSAAAFVHDHYDHPVRAKLIHHASTLHEWDGLRYRSVTDDAVRAKIMPWLTGALRMGSKELEPFPANPDTTSDVLKSVKMHVQGPDGVSLPFWIGGEKGRPPVHELLICRNGVLHVPTGQLLECTPDLFSVCNSEVAFDPDARQPERFLRFLDDMFGDDQESTELLQEWFGYCLLPDTRQQKALMMVGPKRSGKGTTAGILSRLLGRENVAYPTMTTFGRQFGLEPICGRQLAVVSDARFTGQNGAAIVERLLPIIAGEPLTVERKFQRDLTAPLGTRIMLLTNELPALSDASGALASRFLILQLRNSFYGREDHDLEPKLAEELPGILLWAIEGWKRLQSRGRFLQPDTADDAVRHLHELGSPVRRFVDECCEVGPGRRVSVEDLFDAWKRWSSRCGVETGTSQLFGRDLRAACPHVITRRNRDRFYEGIALRPAHAAGVASTTAHHRDGRTERSAA